MFRSRRNLLPPRLRARRRHALLIRGVLAVFLILGAFTGAVALSRVDSLSVVAVNVRGASTVPVSDIESLVRDELSGNRLFLFPRSNIALYPKREIAAAVSALSPRIRSVSVARDDARAIGITVAERTPHALWCGNSPAVAEPCYFLDETGVIFAESPEFSGDVFFRYFGPVEGGPAGAAFLPGEFPELDFFTRSVQEAEVKAVSLSVLDGPDAELTLSDGTRILFNRTHDLSGVLQNLSSVLGADIFRSQGALALDYVDLRFGNKVFYKFK